MSLADELIDIYDSEHNPVGRAGYAQAHQEGLWHEAFHCWIIKRDEDGNKIWLQHRGKKMKNYPNLLDISSGGHLQSGVKPRQGGTLQIKKELGISINPDDLNKLFTTTMINGKESGLNNREFCAVYLYETNRAVHGLVLDKLEVDGIFESNFDEIYELFHDKRKQVVLSGAERNDDNTYTYLDREVTLTDFVPHGSDYYFKVFDAIKRVLESK